MLDSIRQDIRLGGIRRSVVKAVFIEDNTVLKTPTKESLFIGELFLAVAGIGATDRKLGTMDTYGLINLTPFLLAKFVNVPPPARINPATTDNRPN